MRHRSEAVDSESNKKESRWDSMDTQREFLDQLAVQFGVTRWYVRALMSRAVACGCLCLWGAVCTDNDLL